MELRGFGISDIVNFTYNQNYQLHYNINIWFRSPNCPCSQEGLLATQILFMYLELK